VGGGGGGCGGGGGGGGGGVGGGGGLGGGGWGSERQSNIFRRLGGGLRGKVLQRSEEGGAYKNLQNLSGREPATGKEGARSKVECLGLAVL